MRRNKSAVWPGSHSVHINLDAEEPGLADRWVDRFLKELAPILALNGRGTPEDMYRDAARLGRRWLDYELTMRKQEGAEIPNVRAFTVTYFTSKDQRGERLAVIDVLSGRVTR